jgi:uncharacterized membrane protein (DUF373 family)
MRDLRSLDMIGTFRKLIIYIVMLMVGILIVAIVWTLGYLIYQMVFDPDIFITDKAQVLAFIGMFLLVVIALEILDVLHLYTKTHVIHVEVVMLVALTSVARELIIFDYENDDGALIAGVGVLVAALAVAYYFIKKVHHDYGINNEGSN